MFKHHLAWSSLTPRQIDGRLLRSPVKQFGSKAKHEPLQRYLAHQKTTRVELSFTDIKRMIGEFLP